MQSVDVVMSFVIVAVLFALIYKYLPDARINWKDVLDRCSRNCGALYGRQIQPEEHATRAG